MASPATPATNATIITRPGFDLARAAFCERLYRGKSVLCVGIGDGGMLDVLLARGAARVAGVDMDEAAVGAAQRRLGAQVALRVGLLGEASALSAPFDVVLLRRGETMVARDLWRDVARLVRPGGWLVAAALAGDHPEAPRGSMRYQALRDHAAAYFPQVTMLAQAAFAGAAVIPFGDDEVEPVLDTQLAGEPVPELYVAVAGPEALALPYGLIALGTAALATVEAPRGAAPVAAEAERLKAQAAEQAAELARLRATASEVEKLRAQASEVEKLRAQASEVEKLRAQASEVEKLRATASEVERLRATASEVERLRGQGAEAERLRALLAERDGRLRQLEVQGALVVELRQSLAEREARLRGLEAQAAQQAASAAVLQAQGERLAVLERERHELEEELEKRTLAGGGVLVELRDRIARQEEALEAARATALVHAEEMRSLENVVAERDAYLAELEVEVRAIDEVREEAQRAGRRAEEAEAGERAARRRIAELEGLLLRLRAEPRAAEAPVEARQGAQGAAAATQPAAAEGSGAPELEARIAELEARCEKLQARADDAQREAWAHLKARSDAEAAAAEVREDTVRKLKDARKIANVELMRAMEEATRKAVQLKEELARCERDRNEAEAAVVALRAELAAEREGGPERVQRAASEEAARVLAGLEARLQAAEAERDRALRIASEATSGSSRSPGVVAQAAAKVEALMGGLGRALGVENRRLEEVERGLRRAVDEIGRGGEAGPGAPPTGGDPGHGGGSGEGS